MIEDKITKFRELIAKRDEIDALLGEADLPVQTTTPKKHTATSPHHLGKARFIEGLQKRAATAVTDQVDTSRKGFSGPC
jgi:hypothetical protein